MIYKSENELREVISLGKPEEVIDIFLESYLQGLEFNKWEVDKDLEVDTYESVDVSEQMKQWKLDNYQILRQPLYPNMAEYVDAVVKGDIEAQERYIARCLDIKARYPKGL